jgi:hypothetical protein
MRTLFLVGSLLIFAQPAAFAQTSSITIPGVINGEDQAKAFIERNAPYSDAYFLRFTCRSLHVKQLGLLCYRLLKVADFVFLGTG